MTRATCRNCGDPIALFNGEWGHTRLPLKDGQPDHNPPPCRATPGGRSSAPQRDMFEVRDVP